MRFSVWFIIRQICGVGGVGRGAVERGGEEERRQEQKKKWGEKASHLLGLFIGEFIEK